MKKTIFTVMTAAMFAASNLSAIPADTAEQNESKRPKVDPVESISISDHDWYKEAESQLSKLTTGLPASELTKITTTPAQLLYGAPWMFTTSTTSEETKATTIADTTKILEKLTTTTTVTLYGVAPSRTTANDQWDEEIERMKGDVNGDNVIDTFDAIALRRAILYDEYKDKRQFLLSDINSDGKADVTDLVLLQRFLLGAIKDFKEYSSSAMSDKTTSKGNKKTTATTTTAVTTTYDPRGDIVVSLYGIRPTIDKIKEIVDDAVQDIAEVAERSETETAEVE